MTPQAFSMHREHAVGLSMYDCGARARCMHEMRSARALQAASWQQAPAAAHPAGSVATTRPCTQHREPAMCLHAQPVLRCRMQGSCVAMLLSIFRLRGHAFSPNCPALGFLFFLGIRVAKGEGRQGLPRRIDEPAHHNHLSGTVSAGV